MRAEHGPIAEPGDRLLLRSIRYGGGWTLAVGVLALAGAVAELLLPAALGRTLDSVLASATNPRAGSDARWLLACVALVATAAAADILGDLATGIAGARATARLRHQLIRHVLWLHPRAARAHQPGDLVSRLVGQVTEAGQAGITAVQLVTALLPSLGSLVALTLIDPWLGATFVAGLLLLAVLLRAFVTDASDVATGYQRAQGTIAARLVEALSGARTIGAAGTVDRELDRVLAPLPALRTHGLQSWRILARAAAQAAATGPLLQIAVVAVGGFALAAGRLTPGELFAALQYAILGAGLGSVLAGLNRLARARAGARRTAEVLSAPIREYGEAQLPDAAGQLVLRDVTVRDDDRSTLDGLNLDLPGGLAVAVVGRSGSGKSALAAVAGRLIDPDGGTVLLDGVPLHRLTKPALRRAIGYAFERPVLVGETIAEAITLGRNDHNGQPVRAAARAAAIDTFIDRLPDGYRTRMSEAAMSGGEAQRLGLARALHAERLLVLDDATSSLDTVTEFQVSQALFDGADGRTRIIVAHRAATAARADLVVWLDQGRVRAVEPHDQLWTDPEYRALFGPEAP
jgi:ATP-binding cassette subfamily B protein